MNNLNNILNVHTYFPLPEDPFPIHPSTETETMPEMMPPVYPIITTNHEHATSTTQVIHKDTNGNLAADIMETSQASIGIVVQVKHCPTSLRKPLTYKQTDMIHEYKHTMLDKLSGTIYLCPMEGESGITSPALVKLGAPFPSAMFDRIAQQVSVISVHKRWGSQNYPFIEIKKAHCGFLFLGCPIYDNYWYGNGLILEILYVSDKYVIFNADFDMLSVQGENYMVTVAAKATNFILPPLQRCKHIFKAVAKKVGWEFDLDLILTNAEEDITDERYSPFVWDWLHAALTLEIWIVCLCWSSIIIYLLNISFSCIIPMSCLSLFYLFLHTCCLQQWLCCSNVMLQ